MKNNLFTLYHIVPVNDNCSFICKNDKNNYVKELKSNIFSTKYDILVFTNVERAQNYINRYLNKVTYKVSEFAGNKELYNKAARDSSVSLINGHTEINK